MDKKKHHRFFGFSNRFSSIRTGMQISFSVLILLAIVIVVAVSFQYTRDALYNNSVDNTKKLIEQVNSDVDSYILAMERIAREIRGDGEIYRYCYDESITDEQREEIRKELGVRFGTYMKSRIDISNIGVIGPKNRYVINDEDGKMNPYHSPFMESWYKDTIERGGIRISPSHVQNIVDNSYKWVVTISCVLKDNEGIQDPSVVFVDLNYSSISSLCDNNSITGKGYIYILNRNKDVVYHPKQQLIYGGLLNEYTNEILETPERSVILGEKKEEKLYTKVESQKSGWTIVGVTYTEELNRLSTPSKWLYGVLTFTLVVLTLMIANWLSNSITRPIKLLKDSIEEMEAGNIQGKAVEVRGNNEVSGLARSFNSMTKQIDGLMEQNIKDQEEKRRIELKALQSQINPHFLYNTLDSIIWMAEGKRNEEVVRMTAALAKLLRQSISNEDETVLLSREIEHVENYLIIQKMRYQDKLEYHLDLDPVIYESYIIKLVLQPLVENAIYHGIKYKEEKSMLTIKGFSDGSDVVIQIKDTGVGMDEETLSHIFDKHKVNYRSNGVGIYNVQKRLKLYYGEHYGLSYESERGKGTKVTLRFPFNREGA